MNDPEIVYITPGMKADGDLYAEAFDEVMQKIYPVFGIQPDHLFVSFQPIFRLREAHRHRLLLLRFGRLTARVWPIGEIWHELHGTRA